MWITIKLQHEKMKIFLKKGIGFIIAIGMV